MATSGKNIVNKRGKKLKNKQRGNKNGNKLKNEQRVQRHGKGGKKPELTNMVKS